MGGVVLPARRVMSVGFALGWDKLDAQDGTVILRLLMSLIT